MLSDLGRYEAAIVALNKALTIFEKIKSPDVNLIRERLAENEKREWTKITSRAQQDQNRRRVVPSKSGSSLIMAAEPRWSRSGAWVRGAGNVSLIVTSTKVSEDVALAVRCLRNQ